MKRKSCLIVCTRLFLVMLSYESVAQEINHKLASVFVYNFTKYIDWPVAHKNGDFVIGVFGSSEVIQEFNKVVGTKKVGNQSIVLQMRHSMEELDECNVVFVTVGESYRLKEIAAALRGKPTLIICEKPGLAKRGASIDLFLDEDDDYKTKFEINKKLIESNGLIISSQLINLAEGVY